MHLLYSRYFINCTIDTSIIKEKQEDSQTDKSIVQFRDVRMPAEQTLPAFAAMHLSQKARCVFTEKVPLITQMPFTSKHYAKYDRRPIWG